MRALTFVVGALLQLVVTIFLLRVLLPLARADARNQLSQAVIRLTNRVVLPLRKLLPPIGKVDTASIVALVLVQLLATGILWSLRQYPWVVTTPQFFLIALGSLLGTILLFYTFALLLYVLLSWVAPGTYSPASALVSSLCEPLLAPVRRVMRSLGFCLLEGRNVGAISNTHCRCGARSYSPAGERLRPLLSDAGRESAAQRRDVPRLRQLRSALPRSAHRRADPRDRSQLRHSAQHQPRDAQRHRAPQGGRSGEKAGGSRRQSSCTQLERAAEGP